MVQWYTNVPQLVVSGSEVLWAEESLGEWMWMGMVETERRFQEMILVALAREV